MADLRVKEKPLNELQEEIRSKIAEVLESQLDVEEVVFGDRQKITKVKSPSLWLVPESYSPELQGGSRAQHDIKYSVVSLVKDSDPEKGLKEANDVASQAYDALMEDRTLDCLVHDVRPEQFDPAYEASKGSQLYFAAVQFVFRVMRRK